MPVVSRTSRRSGRKPPGAQGSCRHQSSPDRPKTVISRSCQLCIFVGQHSSSDRDRRTCWQQPLDRPPKAGDTCKTFGRVSAASFAGRWAARAARGTESGLAGTADASRDSFGALRCAATLWPGRRARKTESRSILWSCSKANEEVEVKVTLATERQRERRAPTRAAATTAARSEMGAPQLRTGMAAGRGEIHAAGVGSDKGEGTHKLAEQREEADALETDRSTGHAKVASRGWHR